MRVLGIDPGSRKTGWGIVDVEGNRISHVDNGVFFLDTDELLSQRLCELAGSLKDMITQYSPQIAVIEDVFMGDNARSALILGQARGAAVVTLGLCGLPVVNLTTTTVKMSVTGHGRASKEQVAQMVKLLLKLGDTPYEDAADALAVAIAQARRPDNLISQSPIKRTSKKQQQKALVDLARKQGKL